jgi:hypothetical protein
VFGLRLPFPFSFDSRVGFLTDLALLLIEVHPWDSGAANYWVMISIHCFLHTYILNIAYDNFYQYWMENKIFFYFFVIVILIFIFIFILFLGKRRLARLSLQKILRLPHQEMLIHKFWSFAVSAPGG